MPFGTGKRSQSKGAASEKLPWNTLNTGALKWTQKIHTGYSLSAKRFADTVAGDIWGIDQEEDAMLVEVKDRRERLQWSALKAHQHNDLNNFSRAVGAAYICWIDRDSGIYLFSYPLGWWTSKSITREHAKQAIFKDIWRHDHE